MRVDWFLICFVVAFLVALQATPADEVENQDSDLELLLPLGSAAPDFEASLALGAKQRFGEIRKGHRLTIISFWNFGCGNCHVALPELQELYSRIADKDIRVVAVHLGHTPVKDRETEARLRSLNSRQARGSHTKSRIAEFARAHQIGFPMLVDTSGKVGRQYQVGGFPTIYVVDESGKIVHRMLGYSTPRMRAALSALGID